MSERYGASVKLYWLARKTVGANSEFNVNAQKAAVHDDYNSCLRLLSFYSRTHEVPLVTYAIWGRRRTMGLKFAGKTVTVGLVRNGEISVGLTHEIENSHELQRYLENRLAFTIANLNEELFEKAYEQLKKIESETGIIIDSEEMKRWSIRPYHPRLVQKENHSESAA